MVLRKSLAHCLLAFMAVFLSTTARGGPLNYTMRGSRPAVRASNGNLLGTVVAGRDDAARFLVVVVPRDDEDPVPLMIDRSSARGIVQTVYFESRDCAGEPLIISNTESSLALLLGSVVLRNRPDMPVYLERQEDPVLRTFRSAFTVGGCSNNDPIQLRLVTMKLVPLSLSDFPPPYEFSSLRPDGPGPAIFVWRDATGATVAGVSGSLDALGRSALHFRDSGGYIWRLDPSSLQTSVERNQEGVGGPAFQSIDCSGTAYLIAGGLSLPPPRVTFTTGDPTIRVRPDTLVEETIMRCSFRHELGCTRVNPCDGPHSAIRAADTVPPKPLSPPTKLPYVAPLHPDLP